MNYQTMKQMRIEDMIETEISRKEKCRLKRVCICSPYGMPKEVVRTWVKVTDVRVERLQDITFEGWLQEGAFVYLAADGQSIRGIVEPEAKRKFAELWDSTVKRSDIAIYGWDANPWVCVVGFED